MNVMTTGLFLPQRTKKKIVFYYELVHDCPETAAVLSRDLPTRAVKYVDGKGLRNTFRKNTLDNLCVETTFTSPVSCLLRD